MTQYTRDQIYQAMRAADQAGDADAVKALAGQLQGMDQPQDIGPAAAKAGLDAGEASLEKRIAGMTLQQQVKARQDYEKNPAVVALRQKAGVKPTSFWLGIAEGAEPVIHNALSFANTATNAVSGEGLANLITGQPDARAMTIDALHQRAQHAFAASPYEGSGMGRALGGVAATVPTAFVPGGIMAQSGAAGALYAHDPHSIVDVGENALLGALTGKAFGLVGKYIGARSAARAAAAPAAQEIVNAGAREGVPVLTSDVKPPTTFMGKNTQAIGERIPLAGTGSVRAAQQAARVQAVKTLLTDHGGTVDASLFDSPQTGMAQDIAKSLTDQRAADLSKYTGVKQAIVDKFAGKPVETPGAIAAIDQQITRLKGLGVPEVDPAIAKLAGWKTALQQGKSISDLEGIRKIMGNAFDDTNLAGIKTEGQKAVNAIYGPLREDISTFIAKNGSKADWTQWQAANNKLASMAGELDATTFRNVLKNADITPENVGKLLFSKNPSDVERLYSNLNPTGKARAQAAVLQRAFDQSVSADGGLSVERFANNLKSLGNSIGVVFKGDDLARIDGMTKLLDATRRASAASVSPPTGAQNMPLIGGYALGTLFGKAAIPVAGIGGLFARAYESAPVRNALLGLGKAAPGSATEAQALKRVITLIGASTAARTVAHAANENIPGTLAAASDEQQQKTGQ